MTGEALETKMSATGEMGLAEPAAPLSGSMLSMDAADLLRRTPELASAPDVVERLAQSYRTLGFEPDGSAIADGVADYRDGRFDYAPPARGWAPLLARLYIERSRWRPAVLAAALTLAVGFGGYYLVYKPYRINQAEQARLDLQTRMPAQMDALYQTIFEETKVQQAAGDAAELRDRGKEAAAKGDRDGAQAAIDGLTHLRDTLRLDYTLHVVDQPQGKWGFWTFPADNNDATNYYLVVEALDASGQALELQIPDEQTGRTETVAKWGLRVPVEVYRAVEADKADDGVIERDLIGAKSFGFLEPQYGIDVLGGTVTRW